MRPLGCRIAVIRLLGALFGLIAVSVCQAATFTGTVTGPDEQAAPTAKVWLVRLTYGPGEEMSVVATGQPDPDGAFSLTDPAFERLDPPSRWMVLAFREGLTIGAVEANDPAQPVQLALREPATITAQVLGDGGQPLAGATVELIRADGGTYGQSDYRWVAPPEAVAEELAVHTNETGVFTLRLVPYGWRVSVSITSPGYGRVRLRNAEGLGTVRLGRAGRIAGRLLCPGDPRALAGLEVSLSGKVGAPEAVALLDVITDAEGRFTVPECPSGAYGVHLPHQPVGPYHFRPRAGIVVAPDTETTLELAGEQTAPVRGRVVRADDGRPVEGATVTLQQYTEGGFYNPLEGLTDAEGRYNIACVPGKTTVWARQKAFVGTRQGGSLEVEVEPDGAMVPDIKLEPAYALSVIVRDEGGRPVPGALVMCEGADYDSRFTRQTDAEGRAEATGLGRDELDLWACKDDSGLTAPVRFRLGEEQGPVVLVLKRGDACGVAATIVDQLGAPVTDAQVTLWEHTRSTIHRGEGGSSDERGHFRRSGLKAGLEYEAQIEAPNCDPITTPAWTAVAGETHDCGAIALTRRTGVVAGLVVDQAGTPVPDVRVFDAENAPKLVETQTDDQGRFRLEGLGEGPALIFVDSPGHAFTGALTKAGTQDLTITLHPKQPPTMGEPVAPPQPVIAADEGRERAKALLLEALAQAPHGTPMRWRLLSALGDVDPDFALQYVNENADDPRAVCLAVARAHMEEGFGGIVDLIWQRGDSYAELRMLREGALEYRTTRPDLFGECVDEAVAIIDATPMGPDRACDTAAWSELVREFDPARADAMLSQAEAEARQVDPAGRQAYARGRVAPYLCERDLQAALDIVMPIEDRYTRDDGLRGIIRRLSKTDPAKAVELLDRLSGDFERDQAIAEAVPFFPENQLDLAVALTDGTGYPPCRVAALGRLCAVAPKERVPGLIEKALAACLGQAAGGSWYVVSDVGHAAGLASLACIARRRGYSQYQHIALRALAMGVRDDLPPGSDTEGKVHLAREFQAAWVLAFTAPDLARHAIESNLRRAGGVDRLLPVSYYALAAAAAEVDVDWALALLKQMTPDAPDANALYRTYATEAVAYRLSADAEAREYRLLAKDDRLVSTGPTYNWIPVDEN